MRVLMDLHGKTPLVMHNARLADKRDPITMAIAELTKKGARRTESDNVEIERLEFLGGLYHDQALGVYVPTANLLRCFEKAATITRQGATLVRGLAPVVEKVPLQVAGPAQPLELWERAEFRWRASVVVQRQRVTRMRPVFHSWALSTEFELLQDVLDPADLMRIVETAGRAEGLGEARKLGYGRFTVEVVVP